MNDSRFRRIFWLLLVALLLAGAVFQPAQAQDEEELALRLSRTFGFAQGRKMQGAFSMRASGPEDLVRVEFYIDGERAAVDTESPFEYPFSTDSYELGLHTLQAIGYTAGGRTLESRQIEGEFVPAEEGMQVAMRIVVPMLIVVFGIMAISFVIPFLTGRGKNTTVPLGTEQKYGATGGAICPRCGRPFPLRLLGINLSPVHKYDRCPHCGKWAVMRSRPLQELRALEAEERKRAGQTGQAAFLSDEEKLAQELEASRYQDL